ncbi:hypothetical protein GGD83_004964 [Rhodoblastus sphagnicola]|uniref:hypothetical protein n=1 Tax=Rhodoblastus sphagnicola TaxID=333368 RepID=UPI0011B02040|nr:hypothetical protein [Rhodoblastus sphagnicola]MBB4201126.1 hypothetical protein [Rhodoblastus sphagnicola]
MDAQMLERRIDALLDDPLVSLMIRADGVDRAGLARQLRGLRRSVDGGPVRGKAPHGLWRRIAPVRCGACAQ